MKIRAIVNPSAGAGGAKGKIAQLEALFKRHSMLVDLQLTNARGHATTLAREAIRDGVETLAVVGGDGTFSEVCQAFVDDTGVPVTGPDLALIPSGTGGDLRRTFNFDGDLESAVQRIRGGRPRSIDVGFAELTTEAGATATRAFLNVASFGFSARVARAVDHYPKWLGGRVTYLGASLLTGITYRNEAISIEVDGRSWHSGPTFLVAFANGRYFGGGMCVAPMADPSSGLLECVLMGDLSKPQSYRLPFAIYEGSHLTRDKIDHCSGSAFSLEPVDPTQLVTAELDGETVGRLPAKIRVLPAALRILC